MAGPARGSSRTAAGLTLAASPTVVGALTTLIAVMAVFLAYNANSGLPFVPVYRVAVDVPDAARLVRSNEVRIGGHRVGVVESIEPVASGDRSAARLTLKLDRSVKPLPRDSIFRVRYLSTFGLKYVEVTRGAAAGAPEGFVFDGTDDAGACRPAAGGDRPAVSRASPAANGCFQAQAEFDDLANVADRRSRANLRVVLAELGGGLAGRGSSLGAAIEQAPPLFDDLRPVAGTLAASSTRLARLIEALERAASAVAPVADQAAGAFVEAAAALEAISRHPDALAETISAAVPLLEDGPARLARARSLLADAGLLARRLEPGARELPITLPALNAALAAGTPVLHRLPKLEPELRSALVELRRLVERPATGLVLSRLGDAFDAALPAAAHIAPAQTVCNYWNYTFTFLAEHLSQRSTVGFSQRNHFSTPYAPDPGPVSIGGVRFDFPGQAKAPITGYAGIPADGLAGPLPNPAEEGLFKPRALPIGHGPINAPEGQAGSEYPDCGPGQFGYPLGRLLLPGQPLIHPGIAVGDYPGSLGPTTAFWNRRGERVLRDTRVGSRAPTTWEVER